MKLLTTTAITIALLASAGCAQAQSSAPVDRAQIEAVIKDYSVSYTHLTLPTIYSV